jgi:hypothetical protein
LGTRRPCVCMLAARLCLPTRGGFGRCLPSYAIPGDERHNVSRAIHSLISLSLSPRDPFATSSSSFPYPGDYVHGHLRDQASKTPSVEILHPEMGDKFLWGASPRDRSPLSICFLSGLLHRYIRRIRLQQAGAYARGGWAMAHPKFVNFFYPYFEKNIRYIYFSFGKYLS